MMGNQYVFQVSGIKNLQLKGELLQGIKRLRGKYIGGSKYKEETTHLIVINPAASEKFIAACAGGKWIVTPEYVLHSVKHEAWLPEASYELDLTAEPKSAGLTNPLQRWRENVCRGVVTGAFQGWDVRLEIEEPARKGMFERILRAGKAVVWTDRSAKQDVTHVFTKDRTKTSPNLTPPYYTTSYIAEHLFGPVCSGLDWSINVDRPSASCTQTPSAHSSPEEKEEQSTDNLLLLELEEKLKGYISKMELRKTRQPKVPQLFHYHTPVFPTQVPAVDFSNVQSLVECGLFPQALEEVQASLQPGLLPPAAVVQACMLHALQGETQPYFLSMCSDVLCDILRNNPTWGSPGTVLYFLQILQCPQCRNSAWPLLQTSIRFCLASTDTCHSLPSPNHPDLLRFHGNLQVFFLRLFQMELHAASTGVCSGRSGGSAASVLRTVFWNVWERSTLSSRAVQQLAELLVEASLWAFRSSQEWRLRVLATLQEILAVVVEYWAQENSRLNGRLVERGFQDLAEHIAILCQDLRLDCVQELVPALPSPRLRMLTADALFRNISCRKGVLLHPEPLSLLTIVRPRQFSAQHDDHNRLRAPVNSPKTYYFSIKKNSEYHRHGDGAGGRDITVQVFGCLQVSSCLKALGRLCGCKPKQTLEPRPERGSSSGSETQVSGVEERQHVGVSSFGKENLPRGFHRVSPAGETLLHRACKGNRVKTLLHVLSLPGTDVNVKDHAGWTPLHEACNHGSSECVQALLHHCPDLKVNSQVEGVSPLHDALLNQHTHIAKMLLCHAGSELLQLRDRGNRTPLELVPLPELREELRRCALEGDARVALEGQGVEVRDPTLVEACAGLLSSLLLTYLQEHHIPSYQALELLLKLDACEAQALRSSSPGVLASVWGDPPAASLAEDLRTLMGLEQYVRQASPALRQYQGPRTSLFLHLLQDLQDEGVALRGGTA